MAEEIVHHASAGKTEESESVDTCDTRRNMKVRFSLTILSEDLEAAEFQKLEDIDDDCFTDHNPLQISLGNLSLNLDHLVSDDFCSSDQQFNEIVVMPEQADFVLTGKIEKLIKEENNLFLKPNQHSKYVATSRTNQICLVDTMSAKITIFYMRKIGNNVQGVPVILNFTDTDNFICCTGEEQILKVKEYDKQKLQNPDNVELSVVFYMSETPVGNLKFESALHRGWFIHTVDGTVMKMQRGELTANNRFDKIKSESTTTITYASYN